MALAWDPTGDGKMVIRAGWGISYDYVAGELMVNSADAPPYGGTEIWSGQFSNPYATIPAETSIRIRSTRMLRLLRVESTSILPPNLKTPVTEPMEPGRPAAVRKVTGWCRPLYRK